LTTPFTLEREDARADAVQEVAVVAHHQHAAGEGDQRLLQHAQRGQVEVVGRLVEDQEVAAALEHLGQQQPAAFAAAQPFHGGRDAVIGEVEALEVAAQRELGLAPLHPLGDRR
jgi:hypothetical protein